MDDDVRPARIAGRAFGGAALGLFCGAAIGGFFRVGAGTLVEMADRSMAGLGSWMVFVASAAFAGPSGALAGALRR
jgi:hypothetical protein